MSELDPRIKDMYDDRGALLRAVYAETSPPLLLKTAADMSSPSMRYPEDYALSVQTGGGVVHKFPIVDAGNTLSSAVYFAEVQQHLPEGLRKHAAAKLNAALSAHGLPVPEELTKTAALELGFNNGANDNMLAEMFGVKSMDGEWEEIDDSHIADAFGGFSPRGKRRVAMRIKEAGLDGSQVHALSDYMGAEIGDAVNVGFEMRRIAVGFASEALKELDGFREKVASRTITAEELVAAFETFDGAHNLTHQYFDANTVGGGHLPDPYASVYASTEKTASALALEIGGEQYSCDDIVKLAESGKDALTEQFGEKFTEAFSSDPVTVLKSLPGPHQVMIARMIREGQTGS